MNLLTQYLRDLWHGTLAGWDRFWFTAVDPATYSLIRVLAGAMLFYTHAVWTIGLEDFFGPAGWLAPDAVRSYQASPYTWSYWFWLTSPSALWTAHLAALAVFALLTVGLFSRVMSVLAYLITVAYVNRVPGSLFGLDQINGLLAMYLMVGPSGARYSLDAWLAHSRATRTTVVPPSIAANVGIRLIQLHMCVIYFFAGISKLQGPAWWDGSALWGAVANLEYQSWDMTWLARWPLVIATMTHVTVLWELSYCALVWPRITRPLMIALAVPLHLGIALFLGMPTFGLVMLIGNLAFVSPTLVRLVIERVKPQSWASPAAETATPVPPPSRSRKVRPGQTSNAA